MKAEKRIKSRSKSDIISVKEMHKRYPSEWIVIGNPVSDKHFNPLRGKVLFHSKDRDEAYGQMVKLRPGHIATLYTGKLAPDMELAL